MMEVALVLATIFAVTFAGGFAGTYAGYRLFAPPEAKPEPKKPDRKWEPTAAKAASDVTLNATTTSGVTIDGNPGAWAAGLKTVPRTPGEGWAGGGMYL